MSSVYRGEILKFHSVTTYSKMANESSPAWKNSK